MAKIKILLIDVRADLGGGSKHVRTLLEGINRSLFECYVACPEKQDHSEGFQRLSAAVCEIPFRKFSWSSYHKLRRFCDHYQIHIIHSHGRGAGVYGRLLGRNLKLPVIHTFHGISDHYGGVLNILHDGFERWLAKWTTRFIHVSRSEQHRAFDLGYADELRSVLIPNGVDPETINDQSCREEFRRKWNVTNDEFVFGCIARFDPVKRHEDLVAAFKLVSEKHPGAKLILIGDGDTRHRIEEQIRSLDLTNRVILTGSMTSVRHCYSAFDAYVLASLHEGLPLTPIEAGLAGRPIILTNVRGNCDIVQHGKNGLLAPARNPDKLAEAMEFVMRNPHDAVKMTHRAKLDFQSLYSVKTMIDRHESLYQTLCPLPRFRRVALVHDWLFHMRGGEKVLEAIGDLFPSAPIFTLFVNHERISRSLNSHRIVPSWLNAIPVRSLFYRFLLPFFPLVIRQFDMRQFDLIISSHHCVAKGISKDERTIHLCYCHAPMRYVWGFDDAYFGSWKSVLRVFVEIGKSLLKRWDVWSNAGVDYFIANSENVRDRIRRFYKRDAAVIHPPVDERQSSVFKTQDFFLMVSAFVPYKRIDLAIEAFNQLNRPLVIIGDGPLLARLKKMAKSNMTFTGWLNDGEIARFYSECKALIFPTEEDFGMVPVEAMMYGKPVIAYGKGGALETVIPARSTDDKQATGIFFHEQSVSALVSAVRSFDQYRFDAAFIQRHAMQFKREVFIQKLVQQINQLSMEKQCK